MKKLITLIGLLAILLAWTPNTQAVEYSGETSCSYPDNATWNIWFNDIWGGETMFDIYFEEDKSKPKVEPAKKIGNYASVDVEIKWKAYSFWNEPVFITQAKWELPLFGEVYLQEHDQTIPYSDLPDNVKEKIEVTSIIPLYQVNPLTDWGHNIYIKRDVGSPSSEGKWSYNRPGSPSWGKTFFNSNRTYVDPKRAKEIFKQGINLTCEGFYDITFDLSAVEKWYEEKLKEEELEKKLEEVDEEIASLEDVLNDESLLEDNSSDGTDLDELLNDEDAFADKDQKAKDQKKYEQLIEEEEQASAAQKTHLAELKVQKAEYERRLAEARAEAERKQREYEERMRRKAEEREEEIRIAREEEEEEEEERRTEQGSGIYLKDKTMAPKKLKKLCAKRYDECTEFQDELYETRRDAAYDNWGKRIDDDTCKRAKSPNACYIGLETQANTSIWEAKKYRDKMIDQCWDQRKICLENPPEDFDFED